MIRINSITITLGGQTILKDLSLRVASGEKIALFGESGSGKSTLLKALIGMHIPQSGQISLGGMDFAPENLTKIRKQVFYLPQDITPQGDETVMEYLKTPFGLAVNKSTQFPKDQLNALFASLRLKESLFDQPLYALSGGERKRVGLLAGLLLNRSIFIADEPTAGVDPANRDVIGAMLFGGNDKTVLAVTHDEALLAMADRTIEMPSRRIEAGKGGNNGGE